MPPQPAVVVQDTPRADTVHSTKFQIPKSGEANPIMLPPLDTATVIEEMPKQGPEKADSVTAALHEPPQGEVHAITQLDSVAIVPSRGYRLQLFTPSSMLLWGQAEAKIYQQVYSQTHYFDAQGHPQPQNGRSTYYTGIASLMLGFKPWFNFGAEVWLRSVRLDAENSSPFQVLSFQSGPNSRSALSAIGPKLKFQPFKRLNGFAVQTSLLIPVGKDMEANNRAQPYLATENLQWWTQCYYTHRLSQRWQLFGEVDAYAAINTGGREQTQASSFALPTSLYINYFPTSRITVYAFNQVWPTISTVWFQAGVGGKMRISQRLDLDFMYGRFLAGINVAGQANAFNLGIRCVKW